MKLSILIPVYNEAETIAPVVEKVLSVPLDKEIVLVNDASTDSTAQIVDRLASQQVKVVHHPVNSGKGAAICTALAEASGEVIVIQDADFEYDPFDFPRLIAPMITGKADVVYGVRSLQSQRSYMNLGNKFVTAAANLLYKQKIKDLETCYKMMWREITCRLELECSRFDIEAEITAKLFRLGYAIYEVPIQYRARYENKKLSPLDGIPTMRALWKYRSWKPS